MNLEDAFDTLLSSSVIIESTRGPFKIVFPTLKDRQVAKYYYQKFLKDNKDNLLSIEDTIKQHKKNNLWSDIKDKQLESLPKMIEAADQEIKNTKLPSSIKKLTDWRSKLQRYLNEVIMAKNSMLSNSIEFFAHNVLYSYLIYVSYFTITDDKVWKNFDDVLNSTDTDFIQELVNHYLEAITPISESLLREIARSAQWRIRWNTCKTDISKIFNRSSCDITNDQFMLIYWSQVYDMVNDAAERPPEFIINDDEKLDKWLNDESEKRKVESNQKFYGKGKTQKDDKLSKSGEVFIMTEGYYDKEGIYRLYNDVDRDRKIESINSSNSPLVKSIKAKDIAILQKEQRLISEYDLRKQRKG